MEAVNTEPSNRVSQTCAASSFSGGNVAVAIVGNSLYSTPSYVQKYCTDWKLWNCPSTASKNSMRSTSNASETLCVKRLKPTYIERANTNQHVLNTARACLAPERHHYLETYYAQC
eukprot:3032728-Amphidinium_carterae.1